MGKHCIIGRIYAARITGKGIYATEKAEPA